MAEEKTLAEVCRLNEEEQEEWIAAASVERRIELYKEAMQLPPHRRRKNKTKIFSQFCSSMPGASAEERTAAKAKRKTQRQRATDRRFQIGKTKIWTTGAQHSSRARRCASPRHGFADPAETHPRVDTIATAPASARCLCPLPLPIRRCVRG